VIRSFLDLDHDPKKVTQSFSNWIMTQKNSVMTVTRSRSAALVTSQYWKKLTKNIKIG